MLKPNNPLLASALLALSFGAPYATAQTVDDGHFKEWQQFRNYAGVSWNSLATRCPQDGATPCDTSVGGPPGEWIWATGAQVQQLMSYYMPEVEVLPGANNFFAAQAFLTAFQPTSSFCITYACGASGAGLTSSRDENGVQRQLGNHPRIDWRRTRRWTQRDRGGRKLSGWRVLLSPHRSRRFRL